MADPAHVTDLLPAYVNQTLDAAERARVERHLHDCDACRIELQSWRAVAAATRAAVPVAPPLAIDALPRLHAALERVQPVGPAERAPAVAGRPAARRTLAFLWQLLLGQAPLVRRGIWLASALTTALGVVVALATGHQSAGSLVLALLAPVVTAFGMAFIYGPENDPSLEIAVSTPTSPRLVLLSRLTLVFGYDLLLALLASLVLTSVHGLSLWGLVELWFAPMLFLSALTLAAALVFSPLVAMSGALALWAVRLVVLTGHEAPGLFVAPPTVDAVQALAVNPALIAIGLALLLAVIIYVPHQERFA